MKIFYQCTDFFFGVVFFPSCDGSLSVCTLTGVLKGKNWTKGPRQGGRGRPQETGREMPQK